MLVDDWKRAHKWWSVRVSVAVAIAVALLPVVNDQWPTLAPILLSFFPKNGQQWVPVAGAVITIVVRMISQDALITSIKSILKKGKQVPQDDSPPEDK